MQRGEHNIEDELIFSNHTGYIFHDSRGFEAGMRAELNVVQEFVRRRSQEKRLEDRLHAIWFVSLRTSSRKSTRFESQVLRPDGQCSAIVGFKEFRGHLSGQKWYIRMQS